MREKPLPKFWCLRKGVELIKSRSRHLSFPQCHNKELRKGNDQFAMSKHTKWIASMCSYGFDLRKNKLHSQNSYSLSTFVTTKRYSRALKCKYWNCKWFSLDCSYGLCKLGRHLFLDNAVAPVRTKNLYKCFLLQSACVQHRFCSVCFVVKIVLGFFFFFPAQTFIS